MRTSLTEIKQTEQYLLNELSPEKSLAFEARLLTEPSFRKDVLLQQKVYKLVRLFHRNVLRQKTEATHQRLFNDPVKTEFRQTILNLFK